MKIDANYIPTKPTKKAAKQIDYLTYRSGIKGDKIKAAVLIDYLLNGTTNDTAWTGESLSPATYKQKKYINYLLYYGNALTVQKYIYLMERLYTEDVK